jgi:cytochrome P450
MEEYLPVMNESALAQTSNWKDGEEVDISDVMMRLTLNIALWAFFGNAPENAVDKVGISVKKLMQLFPLSQIPLLESAQDWLPTFKGAKTVLNKVTEALLQNPQSEHAKRALVNILKENNNDQFTDEQIHAHALTFLLAGHETTALLLAWCWDMLAHNPMAQETLQAEVDSVLGFRFSTPDDIQKLPYTQAVVKETLRMRPPAWALGREAVRDCEIGGMRIPAGSTVLMSQWVMHHDPRFYDEPLQFRPERWFDLDRHSTPRYSFFPFGGGSRVCIGEHFAMTEAIAVLAVMARHWHFAPLRAELAQPKPSITLRPNKNIKVIVTRRIV